MKTTFVQKHTFDALSANWITEMCNFTKFIDPGLILIQNICEILNLN